LFGGNNIKPNKQKKIKVVKVKGGPLGRQKGKGKGGEEREEIRKTNRASEYD
jgi:hypothetical protein